MRLERGIDEALRWFGDEGRKPLRVETPAWGFVGLGYLIAKGWATYRGGNDFRLTEAGQKALQERLEDA